MADSKHWAKAQAERLEEARAQELELRESWWGGQKDLKEKKEEKKGSKDWQWGSWWWGQWDRSAGEWAGGSEGASSSQTKDPPAIAEPTASYTAHSNTGQWLFPSRTVGEDHQALRHAAMSPASFAPQRHITMVLGRPVVVFKGIRNAIRALGVCCVVLGKG